nr:MAG TPA: hypothetical protein [Caudoviricetes sp.]
MIHPLSYSTCILYKFFYPNYTHRRNIVKHYVQVFLF